MLAIQAFILAGNLMNAGGITNRIIDFANALVGHIRGGLALTNVTHSDSAAYRGLPFPIQPIGSVLDTCYEKTRLWFGFTQRLSLLAKYSRPDAPAFSAHDHHRYTRKHLYRRPVCRWCNSRGCIRNWFLVRYILDFSKTRQYPQRPKAFSF